MMVRVVSSVERERIWRRVPLREARWEAVGEGMANEVAGKH